MEFSAFSSNEYGPICGFYAHLWYLLPILATYTGQYVDYMPPCDILLPILATNTDQSVDSMPAVPQQLSSGSWSWLKG